MAGLTGYGFAVCDLAPNGHDTAWLLKAWCGLVRLAGLAAKARHAHTTWHANSGLVSARIGCVGFVYADLAWPQMTCVAMAWFSGWTNTLDHRGPLGQ